MKDADDLIERVLYLEGLPNVQRYNKVNVGENVPEMFQLDLQLEKDAIAALNAGIALCRAKGDNGSAELLEDVLEARRSTPAGRDTARRRDRPDRRAELPHRR